MGKPLAGIPNAPGYAITEDGDVFSLPRTICSDKRSAFTTKGRQLKQCKVKSGYLAVSLGRGPKKYVHELVLLAFHGPRQQGMTASHINGNRLDNRASNLRWESAADNNRRKREHGTLCAGERNGHAKLTERDVSYIRATYDGKYGSAVRLANKFGVSDATVRDAIHRRTWNG